MLESGAPRQAVVFIHGIGEQRPMDTLRAFADGLGIGQWYSKPDRLSESFELRRFTFPAQRDVRPPTDCYELYWAHHFDDGNLRETLWWSVRLAFRRPFWRLSSTLRPILGLLQVLGVMVVSLLLWAVVDAARSDRLSALLDSWQAWGALILFIFQIGVGGFVRRSLADAARYLTPRPGNIGARNAIRSEGIALLRRLHESGQYLRIVVVGHSLGSVIGYDVLRCLWDELRHPLASASGKQPEAKAFDAVADAVGAEPSRKALEAYQQAQHRLWRENRARGVPWLVTDFVTLGSPLAHASLLLDHRRVTLVDRQVEREYPRCPPVADPLDRRRSYHERYRDGPIIRDLLVGNHAAVFGPTRWTNLYVPVHWWVRGDFVGGPVAGVFGPGVLDLPVRPSYDGRWGWAQHWFPLAHTSYWRSGAQTGDVPAQERRELDRRSGTQDAVTSLRQALSLELLRSKHRYPAPDRAQTPGPAGPASPADTAGRAASARSEPR